MEQTEIHRFMWVLLKFERKVARMLKMCVSALDSTLYWFFSNLRKTSEKGGRPQEHVCFITRQGQVGTLSNLTELRRTPQMPCSVRKVVVHRMTATANHTKWWLGRGWTSSSRQDCTSGKVGSFCKVLNCKKLQLFGKSEQLQLIAVQHFTWCNSSCSVVQGLLG